MQGVITIKNPIPKTGPQAADCKSASLNFHEPNVAKQPLDNLFGYHAAVVNSDIHNMGNECL